MAEPFRRSASNLSESVKLENRSARDSRSWINPGSSVVALLVKFVFTLSVMFENNWRIRDKGLFGVFSSVTGVCCGEVDSSEISGESEDAKVSGSMLASFSAVCCSNVSLAAN